VSQQIDTQSPDAENRRKDSRMDSGLLTQQDNDDSAQRVYNGTTRNKRWCPSGLASIANTLSYNAGILEDAAQGDADTIIGG
jgi:hypothetical protein